MATQKNSKRRCVDGAPEAVMAALEDGDVASAIYLANAAALSELAGSRKHGTPADTMLKHAEVAAAITAIAMTLRDRPAPKPVGYKGGIPTGGDLRAVYADTLSKSMGRLAPKAGAANA